MTEVQLRDTTYKMVELKLKRNEIALHNQSDFNLILEGLHSSFFTIEFSNQFTRMRWNTFEAFLVIKVKTEYYETFKKYEEVILGIVQTVYGYTDDYYITGLDIALIPVDSSMEKPNLKILSISDVTSKAVDDANVMIESGNYTSAFDRIHTAFHGYLRYLLNSYSIKYNENDNIIKLYGILNKNIYNTNEKIKKIQTILKQLSGCISSINDFRNNFTLSHPNEELISKSEAKFAISTLLSIVEYIEENKQTLFDSKIDL